MNHISIKLSQSTGILLEHARRAGMSDQAILAAVEAKDSTAFQQIQDERFRYENFISYADEHGERLAEAVKEGYRLTFNTRNGLKSWLEQAFDLQSGQDFEVGEGIIEKLRLTEQQAELVEQRLAVNWTVAETKEVPGGKELTLKLRAPEVRI